MKKHQSNSKSWAYIIENFLSGALYYLRVFGICQDNVFYIPLKNSILFTGTHIWSKCLQLSNQRFISRYSKHIRPGQFLSFNPLIRIPLLNIMGRFRNFRNQEKLHGLRNRCVNFFEHHFKKIHFFVDLSLGYTFIINNIRIIRTRYVLCRFWHF